MSQPEEIILDDGQYFVELNSNYPLKDAPGMLLRRCARSDTAAGGHECIGSFEPPRFLRRLNTLRGLSHEQVEQVFTRGA